MRPTTNDASLTSMTVNGRQVMEGQSRGVSWFPVATGDTVVITGSVAQNILIYGRWV